MNSIETQVLQNLGAINGYCQSRQQLFNGIKCSGPEQILICQHLQQAGLIQYREEITRFGLTLIGKTLLNLDTSVWSVTPDELLILRSCVRGRIGPGQINSRVPISQRQALLYQLAQKQLVRVYGTDIIDLTLTAQGKQALAVQERH